MVTFEKAYELVKNKNIGRAFEYDSFYVFEEKNSEFDGLHMVFKQEPAMVRTFMPVFFSKEELENRKEIDLDNY